MVAHDLLISVLISYLVGILSNVTSLHYSHQHRENPNDKDRFHFDKRNIMSADSQKK